MFTLLMFFKGLSRSNRWSQHPDMLLQMSTCLATLYCSHRYQQSSAHVKEVCLNRVEIYPSDIWASLNFRPIQRMFHPNVDLNHKGKDDWSPLKPPTHFLMPIATNDHRFTFQQPGSVAEDFTFAGFTGKSRQCFLFD